MYDAKKEDREDDKLYKKKTEMRYSTIYDRNYYNKDRMENVVYTKTAHIPAENMFF